jgi:hypothetical protein
MRNGRSTSRGLRAASLAGLIATLLWIPSSAPAQRGAGRAAELERVLVQLAERAAIYERTALRFACVESVRDSRYNSNGKITRQYSESHDYLMEYTERRGLQPYRALLTKDGQATRRRKVEPDYAVPEPYSWNLLFTAERQSKFQFALVDKQMIEPHLTWVIEFRPLLAFVDGTDIEQWEGKVWVDQDSLDIIQVEAIPGLQNETLEAQLQACREAFSFLGISTKKCPLTRKLKVEMGTEREGLRFPSRSFASVQRVSPRPDGNQSLKSSLAREFSEYVFFDTETLEQFERRRSETP